MNVLGSSFSNEKTFAKTALITAAFAVPAVTITKMHVDMFDKSDKQKRTTMRNKMIGFFAGIGTSIFAAHQKTQSAPVQFFQIVTIVAAPFLGLFAGKKLSENTTQNVKKSNKTSPE